MRFRILGPVEVWDDGGPVSIGGPQQRALLVVLLLNANRVVPADRVVAELWGEDPPPDARALLRGCVARLRRALSGSGPAARCDRLVTRSPGHLVVVEPGELDLDRFEELVLAAHQALGEGTRPALEQAAGWLHEALALWRGPALDGLPQATCRAQAAYLEERRLAALSQRLDADLYLGRHTGLVGDLRQHIDAYPMQERLWAQLMLALHAAGRKAEALAAYRELRRTLVDRLGVEPDAPLDQVHRAILVGADALEVYRQAYEGPPRPPPTAAAPAPVAAPPAPVALPPAQLPADVAGFTGRTGYLKQLDTVLTDEPATLVITAIAGTGGVGKTALAVHWGHRVRDRFPDGQLYTDLRGYAPAPARRPIEALTDFLTALGVPDEQVPTDVTRAAALYRSLLADKRVLVVLDNACSAEQVRPLLPGGPGCAVLVTSRDRLAGLLARDGAQRLCLDVLAEDEAYGLIAHVVGHDRAAAEPDAVAALARLCGYLPLALRIAAVALTNAPCRGIASYVDELAEGSRLAALTVDGDEDTGVRATFDRSYATLAPAAQRVFRLLGLVACPDTSPEAVAALAGTTAPQARTVLERLTGAHLLNEPAPGRYALHDLLRDYAADLSRCVDSPQELSAATDRLAHWYLSMVDAVAQVAYPTKLRLPVPDAQPVPRFAGATEAFAWLDAERANLLALIDHTATHGPRSMAWRLADALRSYFWLRVNSVDWLAAATAAHAAAEAEGDEAARAAANLGLADANRSRSRYPAAIEHYGRALAAQERLGSTTGRAACLTNLGNAYRESGRLTEATEYYAHALDLDRSTGRIDGQAINQANLGLVHHERGQLELAAEHHQQALALSRRSGSRNGEAINLGNLAQTHHALGRLDQARHDLARALTMHRAAGDHGAEAENLRILAEVDRDAGRFRDARRNADAALRLARSTGDLRCEADAWATLGTVDQHRGRYGEAITHHQRALDLARTIDSRYVEVTALIGLAAALAGAGQHAQARNHAERAAARAADSGYHVLEGHALAVLAEVHRALDDPDPALAFAQRALAVHHRTGHRLGQARARRIIDQLGRTAIS